MKLRMQGLSVVALGLALSLGAVEAGFGLGGCPNQPVVNNFVTATFMNTWYEWARYLTPGQAVTGCTKVVYTPNGQLIDVEVESVTIGFRGSVKGQMKRADPSKSEAKFSISYFENAFDGRENDITHVNYQVLDTDYTSYAIVYNCVSLFFIHFTDLYIYTRNRDPPQAVIDEIYDELNDRRIGTLFLTRTGQRNCDN